MKPFLYSQATRNQALVNAGLCSLALIAIVLASDLGYIGDFWAGFGIGGALVNLTANLYMMNERRR